jgi:hypothetical protein
MAKLIVFSEKFATKICCKFLPAKIHRKRKYCYLRDMITASYAVQLNWAMLRIETPGLLYRNSAGNVCRICSSQPCQLGSCCAGSSNASQKGCNQPTIKLAISRV